jgi:hypothetical protein
MQLNKGNLALMLPELNSMQIAAIREWVKNEVKDAEHKLAVDHYVECAQQGVCTVLEATLNDIKQNEFFDKLKDKR